MAELGASDVLDEAAELLAQRDQDLVLVLDRFWGPSERLASTPRTGLSGAGGHD